MTPAQTLATSFLASAALIATAAFAQPGQGAVKLKTDMTGAQEVPTAGDPDGRGKATIIVNPGKTEVCWDLKVHGIARATAAHVHIGAAGSAGGVVVGLTPPTEGKSEGCATVDVALANAIIASPQNYYVNVHNADFPNGAIRGQLG